MRWLNQKQLTFDGMEYEKTKEYKKQDRISRRHVKLMKRKDSKKWLTM
jgi:hypothetical protein